MTPFSLRRMPVIACAFMLSFAVLMTACGSTAPHTSAPRHNIASLSSTVQPRSGLAGTIFGGNRELALQEGQLGRTLALVRTYYDLPSIFPWYNDPQLMASGHTLLVSLDSAQWAVIASGALDTKIIATLARVNQAAITYNLNAIYVSFEHEVDLKVGKGTGTPAQFVAAWRHVYQLAASQNFNWQQGGRLHWVLIIDQEAFPNKINQFWPGSDTVDVLGDDIYQSGNCQRLPPSFNYLANGKGNAPANYLNQPIVWAAAHAPGIPIFIPEWGSVPFKDPTVRPAYIQGMTTFIDSHPEIQAELYWDQHSVNSSCDYRLDSDPASMVAMTAMGNDPNFQGKP